MDQTIIVVLIGLIGLVALWVMKYRPQHASQARTLVQRQGVARSQWQELAPEVREELITIYDNDGADAALKFLRSQVKLPPSTARTIIELVHLESMRRRRDQLLNMNFPDQPAEEGTAPPSQQTE